MTSVFSGGAGLRSRTVVRLRERTVVLVVGHLGVRVLDAGHIPDTSARVEVLQEAVAPLLVADLGDCALRVIDVAEDDCVGGAGLGTGGGEGIRWNAGLLAGIGRVN